MAKPPHTSSRHRGLLLAVGFATVVLTACVPNGELLDGRPCPCAEEPGWACVSGVCVRGEPTDAGMDGAADDAGTDAGGLDAGADTGTRPPPVPTDCWTQVEPCDWADPLGFELVEGDSEMLAALTITSNPTFSPDGCELYYSESGVMHVARRPDASSPFVAAGPVDSVDQEGSDNSKATISPDGLQLFFTSNRTDGTWNTIHRTRRAAPEGPWGVVEEVTTLSFPNVNNWDGVLAPHGLRYYWSPDRSDDQDIFVGERASLDEPFRAGVAIAELASPDASQAEPAVSADGRVIMFITDAADLGENRQVAYATRDDWQAQFGEVRTVPGPALETEGGERESTLSPNACEVIVLKDGVFLYLTYAAR